VCVCVYSVPREREELCFGSRCVCVRERETKRVCVYSASHACEQLEDLGVCVREREREGERERERERERGRESVYLVLHGCEQLADLGVCVCERERERESERKGERECIWCRMDVSSLII